MSISRLTPARPSFTFGGGATPRNFLATIPWGKQSPRPLAFRPEDYGEDCQEVLLLDSYTYSRVATLLRQRTSDTTWGEHTFDLTPWRGRSLVLYFNVYNDGLGGRTWTYLDDVSLSVCTP
ncbi:MAG: hypothetical protein J7M05_08975 [Anaerolineae bacterium]|nr:hypothetical protein [Anaerolineae bacterium]